MNFVRLVLLLLLAFSDPSRAVGQYSFDGQKYQSRSDAESAQQALLAKILSEIQARDAAIYKGARIIVPSKSFVRSNLVVCKGGMCGCLGRVCFGNDSMDYVATILYRAYLGVAESIRKRNIFAKVEIEESGALNEKPGGSFIDGQAVIYFYSEGAGRANWYYRSDVTNDTQLFLGNPPNNTNLVRMIESLVMAEPAVQAAQNRIQKQEEERAALAERDAQVKRMEEQERIAKEGALTKARGVELFWKREYAEAYPSIKRCTVDGDAECEFMLGEYFYRGLPPADGPAKSIKSAVYWYDLADGKNYPLALSRLIEIYSDRRSGAFDAERVVRLMERALNTGALDADGIMSYKKQLVAMKAEARRREKEEAKKEEARLERENAKALAEARHREKGRPPTAEEKLVALAAQDPQVMDLLNRMRGAPNPATVTPPPPPPQPAARPRGDGTPDDVKCQQFGWDVGTQGYAGCRQQLYRLRVDQEQHRLAMDAYQREVDAYERQAERQRAMRALEMSARLLWGGRGVWQGSALGPAPIAPAAPPSTVYIQNSSGRSATCSVQSLGTTTQVYCN